MALSDIKGPLWGLPGTIEPDGTVRVDLAEAAKRRAEVIRNLRGGHTLLSPPKKRKRKEFLDFPGID